MPVFYQPWYLDIVCDKGQWEAVMVEENNGTIAYWPYYLKKKGGLTYLTVPPLCPHLGPIVELGDELIKKASRLSAVGKQLQHLDDMLPTAVLSTINVDPRMDYLLPLYNKNHSLHTRYTYQLNLLESTEEIWSGITDKQRNIIRKGEKMYTIHPCHDSDTCIPLLEKVYYRQGIKVPYDVSIFHKLFKSVKEHDAGWCLMAVDDEFF